eukprot:1018476-Rhodomonas_salina.1
MLWITGLNSALARFLTTALGSTNAKHYLIACSTSRWRKNWWKVHGVKYLTFSFVQGQLDHTRRLGLGFLVPDKLATVSDRLQGLGDGVPLALAQ